MITDMEAPLSSLGQLLKSKREERGLTIRELAALSGVKQTQLFKLEQGQIDRILPRYLEGIARALDIPLADLYEAAGFELPTTLPTFTPYLRAKYQGLPAAAQEELTRSFAQIVERYGYDPNGPAPGEDEN